MDAVTLQHNVHLQAASRLQRKQRTLWQKAVSVMQVRGCNTLGQKCMSDLIISKTKKNHHLKEKNENFKPTLRGIPGTNIW